MSRFFLTLLLLLAGFFSFGEVYAQESAWSVTDLNTTFGIGATGGGGLSDAGIGAIIQNIVGWLLYIIGFIAVIAFIISGFQYLMATTDEKSAETAKKNMTWSIIGVVVALSGLIIMQAVDKLLKADTESPI